MLKRVLPICFFVLAFVGLTNNFAGAFFPVTTSSEFHFFTAQRIVDTVVNKLNFDPEVHSLSDDEFYARSSLLVQMAVEGVDASPAVFPNVFSFEEAVYAVALKFGRFGVARTVLLELRRETENYIKHKWILSELFKVEKAFLLSVTRTSVPGLFLQVPVQPYEENIFDFQYRMGAATRNEISLYSDGSGPNDSYELAEVARILETDAAHYAQTRQPGLAVSRIDKATKIYGTIDSSEGAKIARQIWAARFMRDLGLTLPSVVRLLKVHTTAVTNGETHWRGVAAEELGDIYLKIGMKDHAFKFYEDAVLAYSECDFTEGLNRVTQKAIGLF